MRCNNYLDDNNPAEKRRNTKRQKKKKKKLRAGEENELFLAKLIRSFAGYKW